VARLQVDVSAVGQGIIRLAVHNRQKALKRIKDNEGVIMSIIIVLSSLRRRIPALDGPSERPSKRSIPWKCRLWRRARLHTKWEAS